MNLDDKNTNYHFLLFLYIFNHKCKLICLICLFCFYSIHIKSIKQDITICLCVIAKNENLYVREFIDYYKKIGYNNIFIYDNNDENGEHFEEVINDYIQNKFVEIINFRERNPNSQPIFDAYKDCYSRNYKKYNWISFFDMDEFLELNEKYNKIQDFLNDKIFEKCQNIKINWLLSINDQVLYFENKPLLQRIKNFNYRASGNKHIKSTVRGNLPVNYWKITPNPHSSFSNFTSCSSSGKYIDSNSPFNEPPDYKNAKLKHFFYKSFEEFCIKIKRGKCDHNQKKSEHIKEKLFQTIYNMNKNNSAKLKIMSKIFNNTLFK